MKKKGFTLAEIMIVLMVIGVITAILLPAARNATPNEDMIKFKKAHNALLNAVKEVVSSEKYHFEGDMGLRPDETLIDGTHTNDNKYFCQTLADVMNVKTLNCKDVSVLEATWAFWDLYTYDQAYNAQKADEGCKQSAKEVGAEIILQDGTIMYQTTPRYPMGVKYPGIENRIFYAKNAPSRILAGYDDNGFPSQYKTFCIDIDGIPSGVTKDNCVNECPFSYGIRADGKVLFGKRASEWIKKGAQEKE